MNTLTHEQALEKGLHITATGVFEGLDPQQISDLNSMGVYMEYHRELVVADGHSLEYFFFIIKGDFEVSKINLETKKKTILASIGEGQCFGEMSFLTGSSASANVTAEHDVTAWAIPHASLRQFIETHPGGVRLGLSIATLLARRIQEGNTRLMGLSASLSAYFGHSARASTAKTMEAPQSSDHAEMEIPDEIFDVFARENLGLTPNTPLSSEQRDSIRAKIAADELDIVPWLEQGGTGKALKVRLKFVQAATTPRVAIDPASASPARTPTSEPMVVRVPQVRARVAPAALAYLDRKPSFFLRFLSIASYPLLALLVVWFVLICLPLESRESLIASSGFRSIPGQALLQKMILRIQTQSSEITLTQGAVYSTEMQIPRPVGLSARLKLDQQPITPVTLVIRLISKDTPDAAPVLETTVNIETNQSFSDLFSVKVTPGRYAIECKCQEVPEDRKLSATLQIRIRR